jgi:hypothetical protein
VIAAAILLALPLAATPAAARPGLPPTPPDVAMRMNALFAKTGPTVHAWVDTEARKLRGMPPPDAAVLESDARQGFPSAQPPLAPGPVDTLAAMAAYQVVNDIDSEARLAQQGPAGAESLSKLADRKGAFLRILSTLLRKTTEADAAIVAALK